jgi:hypothetical protein
MDSLWRRKTNQNREAMTTFDRIMLTLTALTLAALIVVLNSCGIRKVTVHGQYGEYSFKPYRAIEIETDSK